MPPTPAGTASPAWSGSSLQQVRVVDTVGAVENTRLQSLPGKIPAGGSRARVSLAGPDAPRDGLAQDQPGQARRKDRLDVHDRRVAHHPQARQHREHDGEGGAVEKGQCSMKSMALSTSKAHERLQLLRRRTVLLNALGVGL